MLMKFVLSPASSNCVINLSPDKPSVIREAHRVLKEGGEFYFSDVYVKEPLPEHIRKHKVLWGKDKFCNYRGLS